LVEFPKVILAAMLRTAKSVLPIYLGADTDDKETDGSGLERVSRQVIISRLSGLLSNPDGQQVGKLLPWLAGSFFGEEVWASPPTGLTAYRFPLISKRSGQTLSSSEQQRDKLQTRLRKFMTTVEWVAQRPRVNCNVLPLVVSLMQPFAVYFTPGANTSESSDFYIPGKTSTLGVAAKHLKTKFSAAMLAEEIAKLPISAQNHTLLVVAPMGISKTLIPETLDKGGQRIYLAPGTEFKGKERVTIEPVASTESPAPTTGKRKRAEQTPKGYEMRPVMHQVPMNVDVILLTEAGCKEFLTVQNFLWLQKMKAGVKNFHDFWETVDVGATTDFKN